jgi:hypothetical protein
LAKGQSFPVKKGNKSLIKEAMIKKAKAHLAETEEGHDEDEAYNVEEEEDESNLKKSMRVT